MRYATAIAAMMLVGQAWAGLSFTVDTLDNGLTVILAPREGPPVAAVFCIYRWGAADEPRGLEGVAHFVEHMTFKGPSPSDLGDQFNMVDQTGGYNNGYTTHDATAYYEVLPASHLEIALRIESERMGSMPFVGEELESERTVVLSELEGGAGDPTERLWDAVTFIAYDAHPYGVPIIGLREDLEKTTRDEVIGFYRQGYVPSNAVLVIAGGFDPAGARSLVDKHFASIPSAPKPLVRWDEEPPQRGEKRTVVRGVGPSSMIYLTYMFPALGDEDYLASQMAEGILAGVGWGISPQSRLFGPLIASGLVTDGWSGAGGDLDPSYGGVFLELNEGAEPSVVESTLVAEVERLRTEGPTEDELARAKRAYRVRALFETENAEGLAERLAYAVSFGIPAYVDGFVSRLESVTLDDVRRAFEMYFDPDRRVVGWFLPDSNAVGDVARGGHVERSAKPSADSTVLPAEAQAPTLPRIERSELSNGVRVAVMRRPGSGTFALALRAVRGWADDPASQSGVAQVMTRALTTGADGMDEATISATFDSLGARAGASAGVHQIALGAKGPADNFEAIFDLAAAVWTRPDFPEARITSIRDDMMSDIQYSLASPSGAAEHALISLLYPADHPYRPDGDGEADDLRVLTTGDVRAFHRGAVRPENTILVVVGDVSARDVKKAAQRVLGRWRAEGAALPKRRCDASAPVPADTFVLVPDRAESDVVMAVFGPSMNDRDYFAATLLNSIFAGFGMGGRLGTDVREVHGLAYGAGGWLPQREGPAPWTFYAGVNPANVSKARERFAEQFAALLADPGVWWEVERSKNSLVGSSVVALETDEDIASYVAFLLQYDYPDDYLARRRDAIRATTHDDLVRVAHRFFEGGPTVKVVAGPTSE